MQLNSSQNEKLVSVGGTPKKGHPFHGDKPETCGEKVKRRKKLVIGLVVVALLVILITVIVVATKKKPTPPVPPVPPGPDSDIVNPYQVGGISFLALNFMQGNLIVGDKQKQEAPQSLNHFLSLSSQVRSENGTLVKPEPKDIQVGANNQLVTNISFEFGQADYKTFYMLMTDAENYRYSIPEKMANKPRAKDNMRLDMCGFELLKNPFGFQFVDSRNPDNIYITTKNASFVMYDKYIQMDLHLQSRRIFGLGERNREFALKEGTWTMWANGQETPYDDGTGGLQTYGVHPFVLVQTAIKGEFIGIYFRNSNAMSPVIRYEGDSQAIFSYITTGGQIEMYIFFKGNAKQIIKQYQNLVGLPYLPPFWALGWHASAYAYNTQPDVEENINGYANASMPLETVWLDIPYLDAYSDFSVNQTAFPNITDLTNQLHAKGMRMVPIIDAGLSADNKTNKYYQMAIDKNLLMLSSINGGSEDGKLTTHVWPNKTVFLDFFDDAAKEVWGQGLRDLYQIIPYDGIWLDMNEATGFCNGECPDGKVPQIFADVIDENSQNKVNHTWWHGYENQDTNSTYFLPFIPGRFNLDNMSLSLNATHPSDPSLRQYDTHSLFGHSEAKATREIFLNSSQSPIKDQRVFLLSRSTFAGSGKYTSHWLGDNHRTWSDMKHSISGVMNFNMFGIPVVGPDTGGFFEDKSMSLDQQQELVGRWFQLATFFTFGRQHRDKYLGGEPNEPWRLPEPYQTWARNALYDRLQYVRHVYTCIFEASQSGQTCFDPLLFHYPENDHVFDDTESSFIVADALKVSPILESGVGTKGYYSYFPNGDWVNMKNFQDMFTVNDPSGGASVLLDSKDGRANVHLRAGQIVTFQDNSDHKFNLTSDMIKAPLQLVANRDPNGHAEGKLFLDKTNTLSEIDTKVYEFYKFHLNGGQIMKENLNDGLLQGTGYALDSFVIANAHDLMNTNYACMVKTDGTKVDLEVSKSGQVLTIQGDQPIEFFTLQTIYFGTHGNTLNMCDPSESYYSLKGGKQPPLDSNNASFTLSSLNSKSFKDLQMNLAILDSGILNIHWNYVDHGDFQVPFEVPLDIVAVNKTKLHATYKLSDFVKINQPKGNGPITISIVNGTNTQNPEQIFTLNGMLLSNHFNHINMTVSVDKTNFKGVMGLWEQTSNSLWLPDGIYSLWSRDIPNPVQDGKLPGKNLYGTHPVYIGKGTGAGWFGVYTNLAAAQDWLVRNDKGNGIVNISTTAAGGLGDVYVMLGKNPDEVTKLYHSLVGTPVLVPQWALGWHQCRWGYTSTDMLKMIVDYFRMHGLPLETIWSDIDYMNSYQDFTYDPVNFKGLADFVQTLHQNYSMHYIPIIDAGIAKFNDYMVWQDGQKEDIFIKTDGGKIFTGQVWPNDAAYPDFFHPNAQSWWGKWLSYFHSQIAFDGLWEDMNEASNFCDGACYVDEAALSPVKNQLYYIPTGRDLESKSITLDAKHANGYTQLDTHSLYGTTQAKATHAWFQSQNMRTMIIQRSAFAGLGKFASRWLGDNFSTADYMGYSVTGLMASNFAGIPFAGADICGFIGDTTPELCARWYTLGAFYPFSRNHNNWGSKNQEPWEFAQVYELRADQTAILYSDIISDAMFTKLHLIRYYSTQLTLTSLNGGSFIRPLFYDFPNHNESLSAPQYLNQMIGPSFKLSIQSNKLNVNSTEFVFPPGTWCDVFKPGPAACFNSSTGTSKILSTKAYDFYLHLREGHIVPMQNQTEYGGMNTKDMQNKPVDFLILPSLGGDGNWTASGHYTNDDGLTLDIENQMNKYMLSYIHSNVSVLTINVQCNRQNQTDRINANDDLGTINILNAKNMGLDQHIYLVTAHNVQSGDDILGEAVYDQNKDQLVLRGMKDKQSNVIGASLNVIDRILFEAVPQKPQPTQV